MEMLKMLSIADNTILLLPIDADIPLSEIIDYFNKQKNNNFDFVIIDMLVYVGNKENRFQSCNTKNGKICLKDFKLYEASEKIIQKSYQLFSSAPRGYIARIISPSIRKMILNNIDTTL